MNEELKKVKQSLLLSLCWSFLCWCSSSCLSNSWFILLWNWHSLSILSQFIEHVSTSSTCVSVGMISHIGTYFNSQ